MKVSLYVELKRDNGTPVTQPISSGEHPTRSAAQAAVAAELARRVAAAQASAADLAAAEAAFAG